MTNSIAPGPDYDAALWGVAFGVRRDRRFLGVTGRSPGEMLNGLFTNSLPGPLGEESEGIRRGSIVYGALLTAKGRMITDLRALRDPAKGFVLDLPWVGADAALAHFAKFLPPRLAAVEDRSRDLSLLTLLGPEAPALLTKAASQMGVAGSLEGMADLVEGEELLFFSSKGGGDFRVTRNGDSHSVGWDVLLSQRASEGLRDRLDAAGGVPLTQPTLDVLRVEKGRPVFGKDMDENTIPMEAGIQGRAINNEKGCFAGQEVVIRVRDRGHVNKELRGLLLGEAPIPPSGQGLFLRDREKSIGRITSAVSSPAFGQTVALGYLQRGIEAGQEVQVGSSDGPVAQVRELTDEGWILD